jgi:hypothetical protein
MATSTRPQSTASLIVSSPHLSSGRSGGERGAVTGHMGRGKSLGKAIADLAMTYADQTELDHQAFLETIGIPGLCPRRKSNKICRCSAGPATS